MLAVVIPTYKRADGRTPELLKRALMSVQNQTYNNYRIFVIGDGYEDMAELCSIVENIKCECNNLLIAKERSLYPVGYNLFCAGGVNATNYGIKWALSEGISRICHLDHDDYWSPDHLEIINSRKEPFVCTRSTYLESTLPNAEEGAYTPEPCGVVHSATCIDFKKVKLRYRDCFQEEGAAYPADADLWKRMSHIQGYFIDKITCFHEEEGYSR